MFLRPSLLLGLRALSTGWQAQPPAAPRVGVRVNLAASFRSLSTSPNKPLTANIQKNLRKLYLQVHPDFFGAHPEAKDTNQESLTLLHGFIDNFTASNARDRGSGKSIQLVFYLKENDATPSDEGEEKPESLRNVSVTLRDSGSPTQRQSQLIRLFEECGIVPRGTASADATNERPFDPNELREQPSPRPRAFYDTENFEGFMAYMEEEGREMSIFRRTQFMEAEIMKSQLQMSRNVHVAFPDGWSGDQMLDMIKSLRMIFDQRPEMDPASTTITFGKKNGVFHPGVVVLDWKAGSGGMEEFLCKKVDFDALREKRMNHMSDHKRIAEIERKLINRWGIHHLFAEQSLYGTLEYSGFLNRFENVDSIVDFMDDCSWLDNCVVMVRQNGVGARSQQHPFAVSSKTGVMKVPLSAQEHSLRGFMTNYGQKAARTRQGYEFNERLMEGWLQRARRDAYLRSLTRNEALDPEKIKEACNRISLRRGELSTSLSGMRVRLDDHNALGVDGTVHIKWNFEL